METGERSDSLGKPYLVIGDEKVAEELINQQSKKAEEVLAAIIQEDPAFPMWQVQAFDPPAEEVIPDGNLDTSGITLMEMIEEEIGPLVVGEQDPAPVAETEEPSAE